MEGFTTGKALNLLSSPAGSGPGGGIQNEVIPPEVSIATEE
jgi:hypothetical protein